MLGTLKGGGPFSVTEYKTLSERLGCRWLGYKLSGHVPFGMFECHAGLVCMLNVVLGYFLYGISAKILCFL